VLKNIVCFPLQALCQLIKLSEYLKLLEVFCQCAFAVSIYNVSDYMVQSLVSHRPRT